MPKIPQLPTPSERDTPFAHVVREWMWNQRPPISTGTLVNKLLLAGKRTTRQTIQNWIYHGATPTLSDAMEVLAILSIPLDQLIAAYRAMSIPTPPLLTQATQLTGAPTPRPFTPPVEPGASAGADPWDEMIATTATSMQRAGISPEAIAEVVAHLHARREGRAREDQLAHRQLEEHHYGSPISGSAATPPGSQPNSQSGSGSEHYTPPPSRAISGSRPR